MKSLLTSVAILFIFSADAQTDSWIQTGIRDTVLDIHGDSTFIWLATEHQGVKRFDPASGTITVFNATNSNMTASDVRAIECAFGNVYAGSYDAGLFVYDGAEWTHLDTNNSALPGNSIRDFATDPSDSSIWIATNNGLARMRGNTWEIFDSLNSDIAGNVLTCLHRSNNGTLWIGTRYAGMSRLQDGTWETFNYSNAGINDDQIRTIAEDDLGFLYVADLYGVNKYDIDDDNWVFVFTMYTAPMTSERVNRMAFDSADTFWLVSHYGVMRADSANYWTLFYAETSDLPHNTADGLFIDAQDRAWIGTYGGLAYYDSKEQQPIYPTGTISLYPNPASHILSIALTQSYDHPPVFAIYSADGKCIRKFEGSNIIAGELSYTLDISDLAPGMYVLQVDDQQRSMSSVFCKQ